MPIRFLSEIHNPARAPRTWNALAGCANHQLPQVVRTICMINELGLRPYLSIFPLLLFERSREFSKSAAFLAGVFTKRSHTPRQGKGKRESHSRRTSS